MFWQLLLISVAVAIAYVFTRTRHRTGMKAAQQPIIANKYDVKPLADFNISKVEPINYRPYATQGHVTMGIQKRTRDDWIRMDRGYLDRIAERRPLIENKAEYTIGTGPLVNDAIKELYHEIMVDYLPHRYPSIFSMQQGRQWVLNKLTGEEYPLVTAGVSPEDMLRFLGLNVEEDFYIMCPDADDGQFKLRGYIACFPGGFLSPATRGKSVREIHQPVPGYEDRLGRSVDRYFDRMKPGDFIGRMNWSLQVDGIDLFRIDGNNFYPEKDEDHSQEKYQPKFEDCYLRVEHQTLCALPQSKAIIFCVRSYMTPLEKIKAAGEGKQLAKAIKSMPEKLYMYKMGHFWGEVVLPWLEEDI